MEDRLVTCEGYNARLWWNVDQGAATFYDAATGNVVAMVGAGTIPSYVVRCIAGPPEFTLPTCDWANAARHPCPVDASAATR